MFFCIDPFQQYNNIDLTFTHQQNEYLLYVQFVIVQNQQHQMETKTKMLQHFMIN